MNGSYDFIIVGCDGMLDTITPEGANEIVFDHLEENKAEGEDMRKYNLKVLDMLKLILLVSTVLVSTWLAQEAKLAWSRARRSQISVQAYFCSEGKPPICKMY